MKYLPFLASFTLTVSLSAQIGIGTITPSEELDIESSDATNTSIDINNTGGGDPLIHFQVAGTSTFSIGVDNSDADKLKIGTTGLETNTRLTIDASGNVGIGDDAPANLLEVDGSARFNKSGAAVDFQIESDATAYMFFVDGTNDRVGISASSPSATLDVNGSAIFNKGNGNNDFDVEGQTDGALLFVDASADMVGISTSTPTSMLDIQGGMGLKTNTITAATTLDNTHNVVLCNTGPYTVTLPTAASVAGKTYYIKNIDAQGDNITIDGNSTETIDGTQTIVLWKSQDAVRIVSDGSNWHVIGGQGRKGMVVKVTESTSWTLTASNTDTDMDGWDNEILDENGEFASSRFTVAGSGAGTYEIQISYDIQDLDASNLNGVSLYVNGSRYHSQSANENDGFFAGARSSTANYTHYISGSVTVDLAVGDYVEIYMYGVINDVVGDDSFWIINKL